MEKSVLQTDFPGLKLASRGKVRDIYDLGDELLIVTTDRISAFDVIMNEGVPNKGYVLNQISAFHFDLTEDIVPNHMISADSDDFPCKCEPYISELAGRSMWVFKAEPLPVECIVRGYISGSGWKDYQKTGAICGIKLPPGLVESDQLPQPIFTPSTKAELGTHDENIGFEKMIELLNGNADLAERIRDICLRLYVSGCSNAESRGVIVADTKFELGLYDGELILIDECMTPDSSRFWPKDLYRPGGPQPSFDKQYLRDYLEGLVADGKWNKQAPPPPLPAEVVAKTSEKYMEALQRIAR